MWSLDFFSFIFLGFFKKSSHKKSSSAIWGLKAIYFRVRGYL